MRAVDLLSSRSEHTAARGSVDTRRARHVGTDVPAPRAHCAAPRRVTTRARHGHHAQRVRLDTRVACTVRSARTNSLAANSANIMITTVLNALLGYGYWTAAARLLPAAEVGVGSALISTMVVVSLLVHLGPGAGLVRLLPSRTSAVAWRQSVTAVLLGGSTLTAAVAVAAIPPLAHAVPALDSLTRSPLLAACFVLGAVGWTSSGLLDYVFIAERRTGLMVTRNATTAVAKLVVLALLALTRPDLGAGGLVLSWGIGGVVGTLVGLVSCHRRIRPLGWAPLSEMRRELLALRRSMLGHHLISCCGLLPTYLLPVVVTARLGAEQNAYFYVTWMIGSAVFMISPAVASALFAEGSHDRQQLPSLAPRARTIILGLLVAPAGVLVATGHTVLALFGPNYVVGVPLLIALVVSAFPDVVSNVAVAAMQVRGTLGRAAALNAVIALIALAGAWVLTPRFGILGSGLAWLAGQLTGALCVLCLPRLFGLGRGHETGGRHRRSRTDATTATSFGGRR